MEDRQRLAGCERASAETPEVQSRRRRVVRRQDVERPVPIEVGRHRAERVAGIDDDGVVKRAVAVVEVGLCPLGPPRREQIEESVAVEVREEDLQRVRQAVMGIGLGERAVSVGEPDAQRSRRLASGGLHERDVIERIRIEAAHREPMVVHRARVDDALSERAVSVALDDHDVPAAVRARQDVEVTARRENTGADGHEVGFRPRRPEGAVAEARQNSCLVETGDPEVENAVGIEIGGEDTRRILRVVDGTGIAERAVAVARIEGDRVIAIPPDDEIENAVAVEVARGHVPGPPGRHDARRRAQPRVAVAEEDAGPSLLRGHHVTEPVAVEVCGGERPGGSRPRRPNARPGRASRLPPPEAPIR